MRKKVEENKTKIKPKTYSLNRLVQQETHQLRKETMPKQIFFKSLYWDMIIRHDRKI